MKADPLEEWHVLCILESRVGDRVPCAQNMKKKRKEKKEESDDDDGDEIKWSVVVLSQEAQEFVTAKRASARNQTIRRYFKLSKHEQLITGTGF